MRRQTDGLSVIVRRLVLPVAAGAGLVILSGCASTSPDDVGERRLRGTGPIAVEPVSGAQAVQPLREHRLAVSPRGQNSPAEAFRLVGSAPSPGALAPRAMSAASVEAWLLAIEQAYIGGRFDQAQQLVGELLAWQPDEPRAWLREANLSHRRGEHDRAVYAYRRVVELTSALPNPEAPGPAALRSRASTNLAILSVEQARRALESVGSASDDPTSAIHRARVETALRVVVTGGRSSPSAESPVKRSARGTLPQSQQESRPAQGVHSQGLRESWSAQGVPSLNAPELSGSANTAGMTRGWSGPAGPAATGLPRTVPSADAEPRRVTEPPAIAARSHWATGSAEAPAAAPNTAAGIEIIRGGLLR